MGYDRTPLTEQVSKVKFPQNLKGVVPSPDEIREKLRNGQDPVEVSIYKWEKIIHAIEVRSKKDTLTYNAFITQWRSFCGYETCALCLDSISRLHKTKANISSKTEKCSVCSLAKIDRCIDEDSTFKQIENHFQTPFNRDNKDKFTEVLLLLLNKMVQNLASLKGR